MIHKEKTPCLHPRKEERRQQVQKTWMQGWTHQHPWWDVEGSITGAEKKADANAWKRLRGMVRSSGFALRAVKIFGKF